ncbi:reverse transcriptase domain-containing protein [Tanacetum coccineum]
MSQLKKLKPDELKEEFDKCVEKVEKFIPMNSELEASKLKRTSINLQAEVSKKQKITDVPNVTKDESEDVEAYMDERMDEPSSEEIQIGSIPQGSAPTKIVKWQIIKTGKKGAYQIIREDHKDVVYVNFPGLLNDLTRDDLKELYRLMMLKYGDSRPEEEYKRVLWGDLKTMFDPPSTEDAVWSLTHQQKVLSWRYFHSYVVHCLTLEVAHIYMLTEVKYPLPSRVCQAMLEKRLIGDRKDECMRTRSQSRNSNRQQQQVNPTFVEPFNLVEPIENQALPVVTMDDTRTMAQLLEAPTVGYEDAIVVPEITANNFEIKHGLLNLVQNKQFFGNDKEDPHAHIRYFNKITSTMKIPNVPNTSVKLMLFPFSLEGAARIWLEKEPPRSIETWDDLVSKFINKFFPPSKTTNLRNEITRFQQKFDETFYEAWDRFNDLLRGCPHHGFSELHQLDTFYNALNSIDQDSLNSAAGGNFLDKMPRECLKIIESKSKVRQSRNKAVVAKMSTSSSTQAVSSDVAELKDMVRALILDRKNQTPASAPVKAVEQSCVTCGGGHSYQNCPATNSNIYHDNIQEYVSQAAAANFNQANFGYRPPMVSNQIRPPGFPPIQNPHANSQNNFNRGNNFNQNRGNNFNQGQIYQPPVNQPVAHQGPAPQTHGVSGPKAVNNDAEVTKDTMPPANNGSTEDVQPPVVKIQSRNPNPEPNVSHVDTPIPKASIPFPSRRNDERRKEKASDQIEKFFEIFRDLSFEISFTDAYA